MTSGLPRLADILSARQHVRKVPILLQKSFCITDCKFSGPYVRRSNNHLGLHHTAMNSQATSVTAWRLFRSAISARLVCLREIGRTAFWDVCNTICVTADISVVCV